MSITIYITVLIAFSWVLSLFYRISHVLIPLALVGALLFAYYCDPEPLARMLSNMTHNDSPSRWMARGIAK